MNSGIFFLLFILFANIALGTAPSADDKGTGNQENVASAALSLVRRDDENEDNPYCQLIKKKLALDGIFGFFICCLAKGGVCSGGSFMNNVLVRGDQKGCILPFLDK